ncbi:MAG: GntR family transcriptional regulator [Solibacillus sp.]|uniref:GntR family transcriptional regulator n=1 Tax=unclassified Solibacillus TaxID=2637870 RepID=UPI0030F6F4BB
MDKQELLVKDYLLQGIFSGQFEEDGKMPSEYQLVDQFKLSRIKVRHVYNLLEKMGIIYSQKGVGRFIKHRQKPLAVVMSGDISFSEKMIQQTSNYKSIVTKLEQLPFDHAIYSKPYVKQHTLYLVERLRFIDHEPAAIHRSYIVVDHMPYVKQIDHRLTSMYQFYQRNGVQQFESTFSQLTVSFPSELERTLLNCEVLVPLVRVESDNWDAERDVLLEYTEILYRTDRFHFQF